MLSTCLARVDLTSKFTSDEKKVLVKIPEEKRREGVKNKDLMKGYILEEKALGIQWTKMH